MLAAISPLRLVVWMAENEGAVQEWLVDLRDRQKLRQDEVDKKSRDLGARISQSYLSQLERGIKPLSSLGGERMDVLRRIYRVEPAEWARRTGYSVAVPTGQTDASLSPVSDLHRIPVIGLASAGAPVEDASDARIIGWEYPGKGEYRAHMLCLEVDGASMDSGDADGMQHGDRLYVDPRDMDLQEGKVYVVHVHGNGIVVKRARLLGADWWLFSDNSDFKPLRPDEATVIGRVFFHQPRGKRL